MDFLSIWPKFKKFELTHNIRSLNENFSSFLLKIGEGKIKNFSILENWKTDDVCTKIYGEKINPNDDLCNKVILSTHNSNVFELKEKFKKNR